jgi:hypothetical protein
MSRHFLGFVLAVWFMLPCWAQRVSIHPESSPGSNALPDAPSVRVADLQAIALPPHQHFDVVVVPRRPGSLALAEGTRVTLILTSDVNSKLPNGSAFHARLGEALVSNGTVVLPEGTLFQGHLETRRARRLMRPGSMFLTFDRLVLPDGSVQTIDLHLVSAESTAVKSDSEGRLHPALSKKRLAIQVGGTGLAAKFSDDLAQLAGGTAVSAGTARLIGVGAAATFFALQKGREVKIRAGDKLEVEFGGSKSPMPAGSSSGGN